LKPTRYLKIVYSSVVRNIQIDLKYKFLLVTDVAWLVIDIFAFTLLGGMVDGATDVTYAMDVNVDVIDEDLHIYIYDVENDFFEFTEIESGGVMTRSVYLMEHATGDEFDKMDDVGRNPNLTLKIDRKVVLDHSIPTDEFADHLTYANDVLIFNLTSGEALLDPAVATHSVEVEYTHHKATTKIEEGTFFGVDTFERVVANSGTTPSDLVVDVTIDSIAGDEGLDIRVTDSAGNAIANATVFIDGDKAGVTNAEGVYSWEKEGEIIVHYRSKGGHEVRVQYHHEDETDTATTSFLMASQKNRLGIDYNLKHFLLVGVIFWAFFHKSYEDTVNTIPEEASRGTIGFLVTNNVSISTLLLSRNIASNIKTFVVTSLFVILPMALLPFTKDVFEGFNFNLMPLLIAVFFLMWFFMLVVSMLISSLNIIFKKITPAAQMIMYGLKVLTGYYFPLEALDEFDPSFSEMIKQIPIVRGSYFIRDVIIIGKDPVGWQEIMFEMLWKTMALAVVAFMIYKYLEHKSQRWGTLEFY
jgi:ABC-type polysaccharide/polyol phosphate export permease